MKNTKQNSICSNTFLFSAVQYFLVNVDVAKHLLALTPILSGAKVNSTSRKNMKKLNTIV